jgi:hemerythrin
MTHEAWGEGLEVGVGAIDGEHRLQIELVKALEEALQLRQPRERAAEIVKQLLDYTNVHFLAEDLMMRLHAYPGYQAHLREHEKLSAQLEELERHFSAGEFAPSRELVAALKIWLAEHIQTMDRGLAVFLKAGGRPASP